MPEFIRHHRWTFAAILVSAALAGCALIQPTVTSPVNEKVRVNRVQLDAEREIVATRFAAAYKALEAKESVLNAFTDTALGVLPAIPGPWGALAGVFGAALATGVGMDAGRKNRLIAKLQNEQAPTVVEVPTVVQVPTVVET